MKKHKPTTPSRRHMTAVEYKEIVTTSEPLKKLTAPLKQQAGRNSFGRITVRHRGGGNERLYRLVDFKQDKFNIKGTIKEIEYDPNRNTYIGRVAYEDGEYRYVLLPEGMKTGDQIITTELTSITPGNRLPLKNIPVGTRVFNIELLPKSGGKIARSAGSAAEVMGIEDKYCILKMPSGEIRRVLANCYATIGLPSNSEYRTINIGKAGRTRWLSVRPTVRGTAMNPCDHPYGGGEGRQPRGTKRPKSAWGKVTGGHKTRNKKKWSNSLIIKRRK